MSFILCLHNPAGLRKKIKRYDLEKYPCCTIMGGGIGNENRSHYWIEEEMPRVIHDTSGMFSEGDVTDKPSPTIDTNQRLFVEYSDGEEEQPIQPDISKPPYRVPSMEEIKAIPWNGYNVISTFSGCGGSSLGYKMAGFRVIWANEFIPAAQETYKSNHPDTILDTRDIRQIVPDEILEAINMRPGDLDILDGSPPCASFSMAGKRDATWGKVKQYSDTKQRVDDLFFEYIRLLKGIQPKVFIAENVSGLVKGVAKGYFKEILAEMKLCGYQVRAKVLDAQWLGVPQMRQRVIFQGVRNDLGLEPAYPKPLPYRYTVRDAIPYSLKVRHTNGFGNENYLDADLVPAATVGASHQSGVNFNNGANKIEVVEEVNQISNSSYNEIIKDINNPSNTIMANMTDNQIVGHVRRKFTIAELKRICAFPDDFILTGSYAQQWERLGRAVPPVMMYHIARIVRDEVLSKIT